MEVISASSQNHNLQSNAQVLVSPVHVHGCSKLCTCSALAALTCRLGDIAIQKQI